MPHTEAQSCHGNLGRALGSGSRSFPLRLQQQTSRNVNMSKLDDKSLPQRAREHIVQLPESRQIS